MQSLLNDPMVQTGLAPFIVALLVGGLLLRTSLAWFAVPAALATALALSVGISFTPLTASRKVLLLVLVAPFVGLLLDLLPKPTRLMTPVLAVLCGAASVWAFWSVLSQRELAQLLPLAAGVALFVALMVALTLRLRTDAAAGAGATLALGLAVGVSAVLSASIGNLANGIAVAAGAGALLLVQFAMNRLAAPGFLGMLFTGLAASLFTATTFVLAKLPWYAMPLMLLVPLAAASGLGGRTSPRVRLVIMALVCLAVSAAPMLAAWFATRQAPT